METSHSENIGELAQALAKAQAKISTAIKDKENPFFKSKYADLNSVWEACRLPLSENGLAIIQTVEGPKDNMTLVTMLVHSSNQWIKSRLPLILSKFDIQAMGSVITYSRRYALSAMVGVCADVDDDGEKAMVHERSEQAKKKVEVIGPKQAQTLEEMIGEDDEYRNQVKSFLKDNYSISDFEKIPVSLFPRIMKSAIKNRESKMASV